MIDCPFCFAEEPLNIYNHNCYCHRISNDCGRFVRIAIGICCGRMLGEVLSYEEECHGKKDKESIMEMLLDAAKAVNADVTKEDIELPNWVK